MSMNYLTLEPEENGLENLIVLGVGAKRMALKNPIF